MRMRIVTGSLLLISFFVSQMQGTQAQSPFNGIASAMQTVYIVQSGDTLFEIAKKHGITLNALLKSNPALSVSRPIYPGNKIYIAQKNEIRQNILSPTSNPFNNQRFTENKNRTLPQSLQSNNSTPTQNNKCIKPKNYSATNQHHFCMIDDTVRSVMKADKAISLNVEYKSTEKPFNIAQKAVVAYLQKNGYLKDKVVIDADGYACNIKNSILVNGRKKPNAAPCLMPTSSFDQKNKKMDVYFVYVHRKTGEIRTSRYTIVLKSYTITAVDPCHNVPSYLKLLHARCNEKNKGNNNWMSLI